MLRLHCGQPYTSGLRRKLYHPQRWSNMHLSPCMMTWVLERNQSGVRRIYSAGGAERLVLWVSNSLWVCRLNYGERLVPTGSVPANARPVSRVSSHLDQKKLVALNMPQTVQSWQARRRRSLQNPRTAGFCSTDAAHRSPRAAVMQAIARDPQAHACRVGG